MHNQPATRPRIQRQPLSRYPRYDTGIAQPSPAALEQVACPVERPKRSAEIVRTEVLPKVVERRTPAYVHLLWASACCLLAFVLLGVFVAGGWALSGVTR